MPAEVAAEVVVITMTTPARAESEILTIKLTLKAKAVAVAGALESVVDLVHAPRYKYEPGCFLFVLHCLSYLIMRLSTDMPPGQECFSGWQNPCPRLGTEDQGCDQHGANETLCKCGEQELGIVADKTPS